MKLLHSGNLCNLICLEILVALNGGCTPSHLVLAWVHHQETDACSIPGTTRIENFYQNIGALNVKQTGSFKYKANNSWNASYSIMCWVYSTMFCSCVFRFKAILFLFRREIAMFFFFFCVPEDLLDLQIVAVESCSLLIWIITCYVFVYEKETSAKFVFSLLTLSIFFQYNNFTQAGNR